MHPQKPAKKLNGFKELFDIAAKILIFVLTALGVWILDTANSTAHRVELLDTRIEGELTLMRHEINLIQQDRFRNIDGIKLREWTKDCIERAIKGEVCPPPPDIQ